MDFKDIPPELYGIILNFMPNPLILSLVSKEFYDLLNNNAYGKCYYKEFKLRDPKKLIAKDYKYVVKLNILQDTRIVFSSTFDINNTFNNITDDQLKLFPNLQELSCYECNLLTDNTIFELKLRKLNLYCCKNITHKSISELKKINPNLVVYNNCGFLPENYSWSNTNTEFFKYSYIHPYKRKRERHFDEWISQTFNFKKSTDIPEEVYDIIVKELIKNKFYDFKKLTSLRIKKVLKKLNLLKYYEYSRNIVYKLSGIIPPTINKDVKDKLKYMFRLIQIPFHDYCEYIGNKGRNFPSYSYILHKFCQLLELDHNIINMFPLLKNMNKVRHQDSMWKFICKELSWQFISSI